MDEEEVFCCNEKKKLVWNNGFMQRLIIVPNVIIFQRHEKCRTYKKTFEIKNDDVTNIQITITSDFPNELGFTTDEDYVIDAQFSKTVDVYYEPTEASLRNFAGNRRNSIFIGFQHPRYTFEVPILLFRKLPELCIPKQIIIPNCVLQLPTYYSMSIYNPCKKSVLFATKWLNKSSKLTLLSYRNQFDGNACTNLLFSVTVENHCSINDEILIICDQKHTVSFLNQVVPYQPFIDNVKIHFSRIYFGFSTDEFFKVCNEYHEPIKIKWCRKEKKDCSNTDDEQETDPRNIKQINENFLIAPKSARIPSRSSLQVRATFIPKPNLSDVDTTDLKFKSVAYLACNIDENIRLPVKLSGTAIGPNITLNFCYVELGNIVIGEKRFLRVVANNKSQIPGTIKFDGSDRSFGGVTTCLPHFHTLDPGEENTFVLTYYPTSLGKFLEKIMFRVENGRSVYLMISGMTEPIRVITIPKAIDFGTVHICSLQKKMLSIRNPLSTAILVSFSSEDDGVQEPLIIYNLEEFVSGFESDEEEVAAAEVEMHVIKQCNPPQHHAAGFDTDSTSSLSLSIQQTSSTDLKIPELSLSSTTSKSSGFIDLLAEKGDRMTTNLLQKHKESETIYDPHPDLSVLQNIVTDLLKWDYFEPLAELTEDLQKKMKLPVAPREYLFNPETIEIKAFDSQTVPVFLVPNISGRRTATLRMKVSIIEKASNLQNLLDVKDEAYLLLPEDAITTKLSMMHNCLVPELEIPKDFKIECGIDLTKRIEFPIKNRADVPGVGIITFNTTEKADVSYKPKRFVIKASGSVNAEIKITTRVVGKCILEGAVQVFGGSRQYPIKIECHTDQPSAEIHVNPIKYEGKVLIKGVCMTYIQNTSNGLLQYKTRLKNGMCIECTSDSDYAYPNECKEICLLTFFYDPGFYKDILHFDIKHLNTVDVPVKINIKGLPIKFSPNVQPTLDLKLIAASLKPFETTITLQNCGKSNYKVFISRKQRSTDHEEKSKFEFKVNTFSLDPNETCDAELCLTRQAPMVLKQDFYVDAVGVYSNKRIPGFGFTVEAHIIDTKLQWNRGRLDFEFRNSDFYEMSFGESVILKNKSEIRENVMLQAVGSFEIFDPVKHIFWTKFKCQLDPFDSKELVICFDVKEINHWNRDVEYEGKILVATPEKSHKTLPLFCKIIFPIVTIPVPNMRFYSLTSFLTSIIIENPGDMLAFYEWSYQGAPCKNNVHPLVSKNFQTVWNYLSSFESTGLFNFPPDIEKEWLTSFKKFCEHNLDIDPGVDVEEASMKILLEPQAASKPKKGSKIDSESVRSKSSQVEKSEKRKQKGKKGDKKTKTEEADTPLIKTGRGSIKSTKSGRKSKVVAEEALPPIVENLKPPAFICKESKLRVDPDEVINRIYSLFKIDDERRSYRGNEPESDDIYGQARRRNVPIKPETPIKQYFSLDHYRSSIPPRSQKKINVYFSGDKKMLDIKSTLAMNVVGGKPELLNMAICNASSEVEISKSSFNAETQPWYKINYYQINVKNPNPSPVQIIPALNEYDRKDRRLVAGYVEVRPNQGFILPSEASTQFIVATFMGFNQYFLDGFGIEVNSNIPANIQFKGCARIPIISILNLEKLPPDNVTLEQEYLILNNIFLNQISFLTPKKTAVTNDDIMLFKQNMGMLDPEGEGEEFDQEGIMVESASSKSEISHKDQCGYPMNPLTEMPNFETKDCCTTPAITFSPEVDKNISKLTYRKDSPDAKTASGDVKSVEKGFQLKIHNLILTKQKTIELVLFPKKPKFRSAVMEVADPDLADYCVLDYPEEYPTPLQLTHILEIKSFEKEIAKKSSTWRNYSRIVKKYVLKNMNVENYSFKETKFEQPIRPTSFKIQPLPFYSSSYRLDFGTLNLDETKNWTFELFYHGPGKIYFSVRSLIAIPGMKISVLEPDFQCDGVNGDYKFTLYNNTLSTKENCKYHNISSRSTEEIRSIQRDCVECTGKKLCHAHSFDFNEEHIHTRNLALINRKAINEFYSWWNRPDKDIKDPYIHCELFQERLAKTDNKIFKFKIQFTPSSKCYYDPTPFEDFIYIDIHLGPTIPILLQGTIASPDKDSNKSNSSD